MSKKEKKKTYQVTLEELKKYEKRGYIRAKEEMSLYAVLIPMWVLRNKFGFGAKRLEDFLEALEELTEDIDQGYLSIKDIKETIKKETGLDFID